MIHIIACTVFPIYFEHKYKHLMNITEESNNKVARYNPPQEAGPLINILVGVKINTKLKDD